MWCSNSEYVGNSKLALNYFGSDCELISAGKWSSYSFKGFRSLKSWTWNSWWNEIVFILSGSSNFYCIHWNFVLEFKMHINDHYYGSFCCNQNWSGRIGTTTFVLSKQRFISCRWQHCGTNLHGGNGTLHSAGFMCCHSFSPNASESHGHA